MALGCVVNSAVQDEFQEIKTGPESINQRWTTSSSPCGSTGLSKRPSFLIFILINPIFTSQIFFVIQSGAEVKLLSSSSKSREITEVEIVRVSRVMFVIFN